jgi:hypothetical protein
MMYWNDIQQAFQMAKLTKEFEKQLMWGTRALIDNRTPTKKIKDFLKNSLEK